jgi:hypothetical protein
MHSGTNSDYQRNTFFDGKNRKREVITMPSALILIILEFFMVLFLALGYLIKFRGRVDLIAGYREGRIRDAAGLAGFIGTSLLFLGILAAATFALVLLFPDYEVVFFLIYAAVLFPIISIYSLAGSRKYLKA